MCSFYHLFSIYIHILLGWTNVILHHLNCAFVALITERIMVEYHTGPVGHFNPRSILNLDNIPILFYYDFFLPTHDHLNIKKSTDLLICDDIVFRTQNHTSVKLDTGDYWNAYAFGGYWMYLNPKYKSYMLQTFGLNPYGLMTHALVDYFLLVLQSIILFFLSFFI